MSATDRAHPRPAEWFGSKGLYDRIRQQHGAGVARMGRDIVPAQFLPYYLHEMPVMSDWARRKGLITFSFLRLKPRLVPEFKRILDDCFLRNVLPAYPLVEQAVKNGWHWQEISVREYNLLVLFADFCRKMMTLSQNKEARARDFTNMEEAYLRLVHRREHLSALSAAIRKAAAVDTGGAAKPKADLDQIVSGLDAFFSPDALSPSFSEMLRAFHMVGSRRFLEWEDLVRPGVVTILQDSHYEYPREVFDELLDYLQSLGQREAEQKAELASLEWIRTNAYAETGQDPQTIIAFYGEQGRAWETDSNDAFTLLATLLGGLTDRLHQLMNEPWRLLTEAEKLIAVKVITDADLAAEVERMDACLEAAGARLKSASPEHISLVRFLGPEKAHGLLTTESQRFIHEQLITALTMVFRVAVLLRDILQGKGGGYPADFYHSHIVDSPLRWRGSSVADIIGHNVLLCLRICSYFKVQALEREMARIANLAASIKECERQKQALDPSGAIGEWLGSRHGSP